MRKFKVSTAFRDLAWFLDVTDAKAYADAQAKSQGAFRVYVSEEITSSRHIYTAQEKKSHA